MTRAMRNYKGFSIMFGSYLYLHLLVMIELRYNQKLGFNFFFHLICCGGMQLSLCMFGLLSDVKANLFCRVHHMSCLLILHLFQKIRMLRKVEMAFGVLSVVRYIFPQVLQTYFKSNKLFCSLFFFSVPLMLVAYTLPNRFIWTHDIRIFFLIFFSIFR